ncbi:MAG: condensation domain-containing protein, partial [Pyrinomonadaceae bacterium]
TLFMTLLAGFEVLLYRYSGEEEAVVGTGIANRNRVETEGLIGFFVNMLVLRTDMSGEPTFRELLGRVKEVCVGAYAHQDVPFEKLVEELQPERSLSHTPLFQVVFVLQNAPVTLHFPGLTVKPLKVDFGLTHFDLTFSMEETSDELYGILEYNTSIFDAPTIAQLLKSYETILREVVRQPEQHLLDIPLLPEAGESYRAATPGPSNEYGSDQFVF